MRFSDQQASAQTGDMTSIAMALPADYQDIQRRAVAYGAQDVPPICSDDGSLTWPADAERVALDHITYDASADEFAGWQMGRPVPEWVQR